MFADFDWFVMSLAWCSSIFQFSKWNVVWCFSCKRCLQIDHFGQLLWFFNSLRFALIVNAFWMMLIDFLIFKMKFLLMLFFYTLFTNRSRWIIVDSFLHFADFYWFVVFLFIFIDFSMFKMKFLLMLFFYNFVYKSITLDHFWDFSIFLRFWLMFNDLWMILIVFLIFKMKLLLMLFF